MATTPTDPHSHARPAEIRLRHLALELDVDFDSRRLTGRATLDLDREPGVTELVLDTWRLDIRAVRLGDGSEGAFRLGDHDELLGSPLTIQIGEADRVVVDYVTHPDAKALDWLAGPQTASGSPFLFTQSQAILARTWVPLQDTPTVRFTYEARVTVPDGLLALMSAHNPTAAGDRTYSFEMPQPIPSYLLALAVGRLEFRTLGPRTGIYAEPPTLEQAAWEFADVEKMMAAVEELYGPYRWERFDMLVLPPSFPWGGMENPRLTFLTPALLAGDRSQVNVIGHELAHSWSGNLVTNATWNDMWLNEGFTTYLEHRIQEALYGVEAAAMHWELGRQDLLRECPELADHGLRMDLTGRDPDLAASAIAYKKGSLFLRLLEETVGRERLDAFLRGYFDTHAFQSMDTSRFLDYLHTELLQPAKVDPATLRLDDWLGGPCFPDNAPMIRSDAFTRVDSQIQRLKKDEPAAALETEGWLTQQWVHFLRHLPRDLGSPRLKELDAAFGFSDSGNSVVLTDWFVLAIESGHLFSDAEVDDALERFLVGLGRRLHLLPIYGALTKTLEGTARAREIYARARPGYHSIAVRSLDPIVGWDEG